MALALASEQEAAARYHSLGDHMAHQGQMALAALFRRLAVEEEKHAEGMTRHGDVARGRQLLAGFEPLQLEVESPGALYVEEAMIAGRSTPYKALAAAVHNEQRAVALYQRIAAATSNPQLRRQAEELALVELSHAALLRAERRKAYHAERSLPGPLALPGAAEIQAPADIARAVIGLERRILAELQAPGSAGAAPEPAVAATRAILDQLRLLGAETEPEPTRGEGPLGDAELAFAFYDSLVTTSARDGVRETAQRLSTLALERLRGLYS